jgi:phasin family protein
VQQKVLALPRVNPYPSFHVAVQQSLTEPSAQTRNAGRGRDATPLPAHLTTHPQETRMYLTADQIVAAHKSNVETLFGLTNKAFEGVEKLVELNLQVAKTSLGEAAETTRAMLSVKDAQELLSLQASLMQPAAEKAAAYSRHLYDIAAGTNAEVTRVVEATIAEAQRKTAAVVDTAVKNAPAGSENAVALVRSAMAAANNAYESVHKAAKQATEVAEANFQAMTATAARATQAATPKAARKAA